MIVHRQVLANLVEVKFTNFSNFYSLIKALIDKIIRELIISLLSQSGDKLFIVIE